MCLEIDSKIVLMSMSGFASYAASLVARKQTASSLSTGTDIRPARVLLLQGSWPTAHASIAPIHQHCIATASFTAMCPISPVLTSLRLRLRLPARPPSPGVKVRLPAINAAQGSAGCCAGAGAGTCDVMSHPDVLQLVILLLCVISTALADIPASSRTGSSSSGQAAASSSSNSSSNSSNSRGASGPTGTAGTGAAAAAAADATVAEDAASLISSLVQADSLAQLAEALWATQGLTKTTLQQLAAAAAHGQHPGQDNAKLSGKLMALSVLLKTGIWLIIEPGSDNTRVGVCCMHPQQLELLEESGWELSPVLLAAAMACTGGDTNLCNEVGGAVEWVLDACFTVSLPNLIKAYETFTAAAAKGEAAGQQAANILCINGNKHVSNTLHYLLLLAKQHTMLLAAAFDKQQALSTAASSSSGRSSTASSSSSAAAASVSAHIAAVYSLYNPLMGLANLYQEPSSNKFAAVAWIYHSTTAATVMDLLTRSVLSRDLSSSSSSSGSMLDGTLGASGDVGVVGLAQLRKYADFMLQLLLPSVQDPKFASPLIGHALDGPFRGGDQRQLLFGLAVSHTKRCSTSGPLLVEPAVLEAFARLPAYFSCMLAAQLAEDYSLAAVRAAVAPWMVLLGRIMRVTGYVLRQRLSAAADLAKAGGGVMLEGMGGEYVQAVVGLVKVAQRCLSDCVMDEVTVMDCWLADKAGAFTGQKQYPDPVAEAAAAGSSSSSSSAPLLLHSKYHLQRPGMPVAMAPVGTAAAAAAGAGAAGGDGGGGGSDRGVSANARTPSSSATAGAAAAAVADTAQSSSSTAQECVLLDDLDSWFELHLRPVDATVAAATGTLSSSGALQYCDPHGHRSSQHMSAARALKQLTSGSHSEQLNQLPEQLYAAGTALCNALAVPWLCNNPDCTNMLGESEALLVGGKSCVCGSCKVAR